MVKILLGCVTYDGHNYCLSEFLQHLQNIKIIHDVLFVDTSKTVDYANFLREKGYSVTHLDQKKDSYENIVEGMNALRKECLVKNYDYLFSVESDVLIQPNSLALLLSRNLRLVGGVYLTKYLCHYPTPKGIIKKWEVRPVADKYIKVGEQLTTQPLQLKEVLPDQLLKVASIGMGCTLIHSSVLKHIAFRFAPEEGTHDSLFCLEASKKNIPAILDTSVKCTHVKPDKTFKFSGV
ncbi:hypothetical protein HYV79_01450 [Candidatus Woesearchaeota archaeon]|nr:hypothetical protein [Candidatus Woesearchaeota archaeon]